MLCLGGNYDSIPVYQIASIPVFSVFDLTFDKQIFESMAHLVFLKIGAQGKKFISDECKYGPKDCYDV